MTQSRSPREDDFDRILTDAVTHPVQGMILNILNDGRAKSAQEISTELGEPVDRIRYHLRQLRKRDLVDSAEGKAIRGVVEHFYHSLVVPVLEDNEWESLSPAKKRRSVINVLKLVFADTAHSLKTGSFEKRLDHLTRVRLRADAQGWKELKIIHSRAYDEVERVKQEVDERTSENAEGVIWVTSVLLCFECPPR